MTGSVGFEGAAARQWFAPAPGGMRPRWMSREEVIRLSRGEITSAATRDPATGQPAPGGLYCEAIFGAAPGHGCPCGAVARAVARSGRCDRCNGEIGASDPRTERFAHIALAAAVVHPWLLARRPSPLALILGMRQRDVERVASSEAFAVIDPGTSGLPRGAVLAPARCRELRRAHPTLRAETLAPALEALWRMVDPREPASPGRTPGQRQRALRRAQWVRRFAELPRSISIEVLPVLPPGLRGSRPDAIDARYARVLTANERVRADPTVAARRELQWAICALFGEGAAPRGGLPRGSLRRALGAARAALSDKRVEFAARALLAPDPRLGSQECALPVALAAELLAPMVWRELLGRGLATDLADARDAIEFEPGAVAEILAELLPAYPVLLAPETRTSASNLAAFRAVLAEGSAVRVHPAWSEALGGGQGTVRVFLPVSKEARSEVRRIGLGRAAYGVEPGASPLRPRGEALIGLYLATREEAGARGEGGRFPSAAALEAAYEQGALDLGAAITVRLAGPRAEDKSATRIRSRVQTTVGRVLIGQLLPPDLPFALVDGVLDARRVGRLFEAAEGRSSANDVAALADRLWAFGATVVTRAGLSLAHTHLAAPSKKPEIVQDTLAKVAEVQELLREGLITEPERYHKVIDIWSGAMSDVREAMMDEIRRAPRAEATSRREGGRSLHPLFGIIDAGAGLTAESAGVLAAMPGLSSDRHGALVEVPVVRSLAEGLTPHEAMIRAQCHRKDAVDSDMRQARAGSLHQRLGGALRSVRITEEDCGTTAGREMGALDDNGRILVDLRERIQGRIALRDVLDPANGEALVRAGERILGDAAARIEAVGIERVAVRWAPACRARGGVCLRCHGGPAAIGDAAGLVAADAIGSLAPRLATRLFHIC